MGASRDAGRTPARAAASSAAALLLTTVAGAATIDVYEGESIQDAITIAVDGDEVVVHPGTYGEAISLLGKAIAVRSLDGPEVTVLDGTDLNAPIVSFVDGEDPATVFEGFTLTGGFANQGGGMYMVGASPTITGCVFLFNYAPQGGGLYCSMGSPTITDCTFTGNLAPGGNGGGLAAFAGSTPLVSDCLFVGNDAAVGGGVYNHSSHPTYDRCTFIQNAADLDGAGMYNCSASHPAVIECTFFGNQAIRGGGLFNNCSSKPELQDSLFIQNLADDGAAIFNNNSAPSIVRTVIIDNRGYDGDGAGMASVNSSPIVIGSLFVLNTAYHGNGGAIANAGGAPTYANCLFVGNESFDEDGGAVFNDGTAPTLVNCTITANRAARGDGIACSGEAPSDVVIRNSILWANGEELFTDDGSSVAVTFSCVDQGFPGAGNTTSDPLLPVVASGTWTAEPVYDPATGRTTFTDDGAAWAPDEHAGRLLAPNVAQFRSSLIEANTETTVTILGDLGIYGIPGASYEVRDYRPVSGSSAIDAGHNWAVPLDVLDLDGDGDTGELLPFDADGHPRFNADELDFDPGCGTPAVVDMGACEHQFDPVDAVRFGDLDGNGAVNGGDLGLLLGSWGPCASTCCLADLDLDGTCNGVDLGLLLGSWQ